MQKPESNEFIESIATIQAPDPTLAYTITFINSEKKQVGMLDFSGDKMIFHGDAEEGAKVFFDCLGHHFDSKIRYDIEKTQKQLNIAIGVLSTHPQFENKHPDEVLEIVKEAAK